jgi:hypothetical protein
VQFKSKRPYTEPNRPQQNRDPPPFFFLIAQQYSSPSFGSLCFQTREEKQGMLFKILLQLIFFLIWVSDIA